MRSMEYSRLRFGGRNERASDRPRLHVHPLWLFWRWATWVKHLLQHVELDSCPGLILSDGNVRKDVAVSNVTKWIIEWILKDYRRIFSAHLA